MSEDNKPEPIDVSLLGVDELNQLSDEQVQYVRNQALIKRNPKVAAAVTQALEGKDQEIIAGLAREPFCYVTPEIEVLPGLKVSFRSLYTFQTRDVTERTAQFMRNSKSNEMSGAQYMNQLFLAHGLETINGEPVGMAQMPEGVWKMDAEKIKVACNEFMTKRMSALDMRPQSLITVLVTANQVFQELYDDVVNLRGSNKREIEAKAEKLVGAVGKSTGPQVAGQKPT